MLHRSLDVIFQYLPILVAALLLPPLLTAGVGLALDRSQVVTTRVWADRPVFTPDFTSNQFSLSDGPAQTEATMVQEMIQTDTFTGQVLAKVEPQYGSWSLDHRQRASDTMRKSLSVGAQGTHLFLISDRTLQPEYGKRVLNAVVDVFGATLVQLQSSQVESVQTSFQAQLDVARQDMNQAAAQAETYRQAHQLDFQSAASDPNYGTLLAQARAKMDRYLSVLAQVDQAQASKGVVAGVQASLLRVVDPPAVVPAAITMSTPAVRGALLVLAINIALTALFVYVVARRDPRVRSIEDVRREVGLKSLGSVPRITSP